MGKKYVKTFEEFINENNAGRFMGANAFAPDALEKKEDEVHEYGCVMLHLPVDEAEWQKLQDSIDDNDVYEEDGESYGRENEVHITLLYGLHEENDDDKIKEAMQGTVFMTPMISLQYLSLFQNEKYDVLKFDIKSKDLNKMNETLAKFPHTTDYPEYHPHATVAYLKPGCGKKYIGKLDNPIEVEPGEILYSKVNGEKLKWPLKKENNELRQEEIHRE
jgi:2'-5' RNA ligase